MADKFYPKLSNIISVDSLPVQLNFIEGGLQQIFNGLGYRNFKISHSADNITTSVHIEIVSYKELKIGIPGSDLGISLNSDFLSGGNSIIPVTLSFSLGIKKYIKNFNISGFSFTPEEIFKTLFKVICLSDSDIILSIASNNFSTSNTPLDDIASDLISNHGLVISTPLNSNFEIALNDLLAAIENQNVSLTSLFFTDYLSSSSSDQSIENINNVFHEFTGKKPIDILKELLIPRVTATMNLNAGLKFPRSVFIPLDSSFQPLPIVDPNNPPLTTLTFGNVDFKFSTKGKIGFDENIVVNLTPTYSQIGNTGIIISFIGAKLDLSRTKNIPEATADGRPDDFIGAFIQHAEIFLPKKWFSDPALGEYPPGMTSLPIGPSIEGTNLLIGTGGFSGKISFNGNGVLYKKIGNMWIGLDNFSLTFQQNSIIASDIQGRLFIPGMQDSSGGPIDIRVKVHIDSNGDFYITASEENGVTVPLNFQKYFKVTVNSLTIGRKTNKFFIAVSGIIDFNNLSADNSFLGSLLPKEIEIQKLLIWENGQIELEGGTITLQKPVKINLGPVKLTVTAIGMGSYQRMHGGVMRKYKYVEFSAGVSINPGGVDARGDGIKVYFSIDGGPTDIFVRIESIAIDLIIPGNASKDQATLLLNGFLSMKEPTDPDSDAGTEYAGGIDFKLPKLKMGGSASMKYNPKTPAFLIDVSLEISTPIVLGATGMGIYGFRALFGKHYVVSRTEAPVSLPADAEWWQYYKKKVLPELKEGVTTSKMANLDGFSFGAGVSLATATDGGKAFSSKLFFLLSLPEVFLLQGQAQILKGLIGLDTTDDPPFYAIIAIDKTSISAGLGVTYKFPSDGASPGKIATVDALIEMAYFWHDSSAWYLNIGRDQPVDRRVRARIFDLFDVYSYFMLSAHGIRAGAGASLEKNYKAGPIKARLYAYMDTAGRLAFKPVQIGGSIDIGGGVDIKICGKGFSLTANASLAAEAPKPFIVTGSVEVCVKILKKNYCIDLDFTWTFDHTLDFSEIPMITEDVINIGGPPTVSTRLQSAVKALNMMSQDSLNILCVENISTSGSSASSIPPLSNSVWANIDKYILPLDSFIDLEFRKPVKPIGHASLNRFGGVTSGANYSIYVAPQRGKSNRVRHDFVLNKVEIFSWNPSTSTWDDYHVYNAITPLAVAPFNLTPADLNSRPSKSRF